MIFLILLGVMFIPTKDHIHTYKTVELYNETIYDEVPKIEMKNSPYPLACKLTGYTNDYFSYGGSNHTHQFFVQLKNTGFINGVCNVNVTIGDKTEVKPLYVNAHTTISSRLFYNWSNFRKNTKRIWDSKDVGEMDNITSMIFNGGKTKIQVNIIPSSIGIDKETITYYNSSKIIEIEKIVLKEEIKKINWLFGYEVNE